MNMTTINVKIKEKTRCFYGMEEYNLNIPDKGVLYLCGQNKTGKTTILQYIRTKKDSLKNINLDAFDGMTSFVLTSTAMEPIEVNGLEQYDEIFCLDSIIDDPNSMENSATAAALFTGGGLTASHKSKGEKSVLIINLFLNKISKYLIKKYGSEDKWKSSNKKGLIILDEVDEGMDMVYQSNFNRTVIKTLCNERFNCDVICVTHSMLTLLGKVDDSGKDYGTCYDIYLFVEMTPTEYFESITGYKVTFTKINTHTETK